MLLKIEISYVDWCNPCTIFAPVVGSASFRTNDAKKWILDERSINAVCIKGNRVLRAELLKKGNEVSLLLSVMIQPEKGEPRWHIERVEASQQGDFPAL